MAAFPPIINETNNGILSAIKASPFKDINSDSSDVFSSNRKIFAATQSTQANKKWFGNRDASQIVANRRINSIGKSLNLDGQPVANKTIKDVNVSADALSRTRAGGYVPPPKNTLKMFFA